MIDVPNPHGALHVFGVTLLGLTPENGRKLVVSVAWVLIASLFGWAVTKLTGLLTRRTTSVRISFWSRQAVSLLVAALVILGLISIWYDDPARLTTAAGLITAGVAVAMQRVITSIAGYFLILRGNMFNVRDRIVIGGVRGDVAALGFLQTTIMEMGESHGEQPDAPAIWVRSRQYTGRLVMVPNAVIFDQPVYNYTRQFPFIFEEMHFPIRYADDWRKAEQIVLAAAQKHTLAIKEIEEEAIEELKRRYFLAEENPGPRVYVTLTDNWIELSLRFVARDHGIRAIKDAMSRDILAGLNAAGIAIASGTYAIVEAPPIEVRLKDASSPGSPPPGQGPGTRPPG
ncbi:MAG: mechanosensitive ion channel family protein [Phenylobacterium sp.]